MNKNDCERLRLMFTADLFASDRGIAISPPDIFNSTPAQLSQSVAAALAHRGERAHSPRPDLRRAGISWNRTRRKTKPANEGVISSETSRVPVRIIHTDEEWMQVRFAAFWVLQLPMNMIMETTSESMKVKNGPRKPITVETEKMNIAVDLGARLQQAFGAAERERFPAVKRVVAQTERGLDVAAHAGSARQEAG